MTAQVLLLNQNFTPIKVISWQKAINLLLDHKVYVVEEYAGRMIRSTSVEWAFPAVVALKRFVKATTHVKFSRANVLARDGYQCMYCGVKPKTPSGRPFLENLTIEHIVPRAQARDGRVVLPWNGKNVAVTCWENVVCACSDCNLYKRDRTPAEAKMKLLKIPGRPSVMDVVRMSFMRMNVPHEWGDYLPKPKGEWTDYWNVELDAS
jgi:5-methylcytosine-specific restriction endonuclease McrA